MTKNRVVAIKADKTRPSPEIETLLKELGNPKGAIPFLAIFPGDGSPPKVLDGIVTQQQVLDALTDAGPSLEAEANPEATAALVH